MYQLFHITTKAQNDIVSLGYRALGNIVEGYQSCTLNKQCVESLGKYGQK